MTTMCSKRPSPGLARSKRACARRARGHVLILVAVLAATGCATFGRDVGLDTAPAPEEALYSGVRQLTFEGRRSGEGYFHPNGREIVFQSERHPGNPFYQIYRMDLDTGETRRISPGVGRTTCGWIHPDGETTLFASTHLDPNAKDEQEKELEDRASGRSRRYAWGFDPYYDLFLARGDEPLEQLTRAHGYDAEGSFSPDGRFVAFSSNRHAYGDDLAPELRERLVEDPSWFVDLYLLDTTSGEIRRLTTSPGYDGGPFFSPDGKRIVWRRFSEDGARAEIHSIRIDGSDERVLTRLGVMSWAPYYHPSGDYVIFTTNRHGYDNFELYLVDALGEREPVRVTDREGFDGLPVFAPAGDRLLWTSNRTARGQSQLFEATWNEALARERLGLPVPPGAPLALPERTRPEIAVEDLAAHVRALTREETAGRRAGSDGEALAADYLERAFAAIGLVPEGERGAAVHRFAFTSGVALGPDNVLRIEPGPPGLALAGDSSAVASARSLALDADWRPLAFSSSGEFPASPIVFAGYGLVAPEDGDHPAIDEFAGIDLEDRWVIVFRGLPHDLEGERRQALQRYASLRHKTMVARDRGARGILFVSGPRGRYREELIPLRFDASRAGTRLAVLSVSNETAETLVAELELDLEALQERADRRLIAGANAETGESSTPIELERTRLAAFVDVETLRAEGRNVLARLQVGSEPSAQTIVLGAHFDHLGRGEGSSSLATDDEVGAIHPGADDNASGTALLLEIAEALVRRQSAGVDLGRRDFVFAAWSGEELGLLGSDAWVDENVNPHSNESGPVAYLNFDMVGRLRDDLVVQGVGSSPVWRGLLERAAAPIGLSIHPGEDAYVPTDATSFYMQGVPILSAFTGVHAEYHTPRDVPALLDLEGTVAIGELFLRLAESLSRAEAPPPYRAQQAPAAGQGRSGFRVFLGTIPDYAQTEVEGVRLSGVAPKGPADRAGLRGGDVIVGVDDRPIENLYDYTYALEALRVGEPARVTILRDGKRLELEVVPDSRD